MIIYDFGEQYAERGLLLRYASLRKVDLALFECAERAMSLGSGNTPRPRWLKHDRAHLGMWVDPVEASVMMLSAVAL